MLKVEVNLVKRIYTISDLLAAGANDHLPRITIPPHALGHAVQCYVYALFSGVTILLSLTVFLQLVAETMPPTSDAVPLIGRLYAGL
jgi:Neurotransmitter-gated ion-channel transmembrane region